MLARYRFIAIKRILFTASASSNIFNLYSKPTTDGRESDNYNLPPGFLKQIHTSQLRDKYRKSSKNDDLDSNDEDDSDFKDEHDSKVVKHKINSLRADLILRIALGMARNKIEVVFYESKIRLNGKKMTKKSSSLNVGDEIDVIKGFSQGNPSHLVVSRVILLSATGMEEAISVSLRRYKSLLIENYPGVNAYKSSQESLA